MRTSLSHTVRVEAKELRSGWMADLVSIRGWLEDVMVIVLAREDEAHERVTLDSCLSL